MSKIFKYSAPLILVLMLCAVSYAKLMGAGEVSGVVYESWTQGERVVFRANIAEQKNDSGPALDTPNVFVYAGDDRLRITEGDVVRLRYNSDDADGIIVEKLEFTVDRPGAVGQSKAVSILITLVGLLCGVILIVGGIIYQKRRKKV